MLVLAQHSPQQSGFRARSSTTVNKYTSSSSSNSSSSPSRSGQKHSNPGLARVKRHGFGNQTLQRPPFPPPSLRQQEQRSEPPPTPPKPKPGSGNQPIQGRPQKVQQVQQVQPVKQLLETYQQQPEQPPQQQERSMGTKISMGLRTSQDDLVDYLIKAGLVKSPRVAAALRAVDRGKYVNPTFATHTDAYMVSAHNEKCLAEGVNRQRILHSLPSYRPKASLGRANRIPGLCSRAPSHMY